MLVINSQVIVFTTVLKELNTILQGLAISMYVSCTLICQVFIQLIVGLSAFPCGGLFNHPL